MKWELKRNPALPAFQQPKSRAPAKECVRGKGSLRQLSDELNVGSPKELRQGVQVRKVEGQLGSLQQTREVEGAGEGVSAPAAEHTAGR